MPDMVVEMPKPYQVAAKGTIDYTYYVIPTGSPRTNGSSSRRCGRETVKSFTT